MRDVLSSIDNILKEIEEIRKQDEFAQEVPPQYRLYITSEEQLAKLPKGIRIYQGAKGGKFVDLRELQRLRQIYPKEKKPKEKEKNERSRPQISSLNQKKKGGREKEYKEEVEFRRSVNQKVGIKLDDIELIEEDEEDELSEEERKYKGIYKNGKIKFNLAIFEPSEKVPFSKTYDLIKAGDLENASHTFGWYYYHMVGHKLFREHLIRREWVDKLEEFKASITITQYGKEDFEEFFCEAFALYVMSGGKISSLTSPEFQEFMREFIAYLYSAEGSGGSGFVYDGFDETIGVKKSKLRNIVD